MNTSGKFTDRKQVARGVAFLAVVGVVAAIATSSGSSGSAPVKFSYQGVRPDFSGGAAVREIAKAGTKATLAKMDADSRQRPWDLNNNADVIAWNNRYSGKIYSGIGGLFDVGDRQGSPGSYSWHLSVVTEEHKTVRRAGVNDDEVEYTEAYCHQVTEANLPPEGVGATLEIENWSYGLGEPAKRPMTVKVTGVITEGSDRLPPTVMLDKCLIELVPHG